MSGGYVPAEVLESPEIATERIKLAARKIHGEIINLWKPLSPEEKKHPLSWTYDIYEYDFQKHRSYDVSVASHPDKPIESSSFYVSYKPESRGPYSEKWLISPDEANKISVRLPIENPQRGLSPVALRDLSVEGHHAILQVSSFDLDRTENTFQRLAEWLKRGLQPDLPQKAQDAEDFAKHFSIAMSQARK